MGRKIMHHGTHPMTDIFREQGLHDHSVLERTQHDTGRQESGVYDDKVKLRVGQVSIYRAQ